MFSIRCVLGGIVSKIIKISVSRYFTGINNDWSIYNFGLVYQFWLTTFIYATAYIVYLIIKRKEIFSTIRNMAATGFRRRVEMKNVLVTGELVLLGQFCEIYAGKYSDYNIINVDALTYAGNLET